jgi:hypothetical protein
LIQQYESSPGFLNPFGIAPGSIGAIFDSREQNISIVQTRGIDLSVSYRKQLGGVEIYEVVDGTDILRFDNQFTPTAPVAPLVNTPYNPPRFKIRAQSGITSGPVSLSLFANYVGSYSDNLVSPAVPVASWTTIDATVTYSFRDNAPLSNTRVALQVQNMANRPPPFLRNANEPINYDAANANPLGRVLSIQGSTRW